MFRFNTIIAIGILVTPGLVHGRDVAPLIPKIEPPVAAERISQFHDALTRGLRKGGLKVQEAQAVRDQLKLGVEHGGCDQGPCVKTAWGILGHDRMATLQVKMVGKNYTIEVRLFQGTTLLNSSTGRCDICTFSEAIQTTVQTAEEVGSKAEEPPSKPEPPAPPVATPQPVSPPVAEPPRIEKPVSQVRPVPEVKRPSRPWPLWPAIVAGGVGIVGLATGLPLIAMDGDGTNCRGDAREDKRNCEDLYDTAGGGWVMTTMGIAGLAASSVLIYLYVSTKPKESGQSSVSHFAVVPIAEGGLYLGTSGRF